MGQGLRAVAVPACKSKHPPVLVTRRFLCLSFSSFCRPRCTYIISLKSLVVEAISGFGDVLSRQHMITVVDLYSYRELWESTGRLSAVCNWLPIHLILDDSHALPIIQMSSTRIFRIHTKIEDNPLHSMSAPSSTSVEALPLSVVAWARGHASERSACPGSNLMQQRFLPPFGPRRNLAQAVTIKYRIIEASSIG